MTETITGTNRSAGVSQTELLDQDTHPVAPALREESREGLAEGNTRVPAWYYTSREFHDLEVEKLWSRVWQLACLEEEIPNVGDYHVYEIADRSFLIVRTAEGAGGIKAFRNACLHRGRLLRETHGKEARNLRCAFHGWAWNLDGSMKEVPCEWDFPSLRKEDYSLPEAKVDTWDGFVFINPDRDAAPLADYLEGLDVHFEKYPFARKVKVAHVEKIMRCNWKACQEAFMEAYHVVATHPTLMESLGDANTRYDTWGNFSRAISPQQIDSPHLADMPKFEIDPDGKQYARFRHPLNGHIYERVDMSSPLSDSQVRIIDIDGHESLFEVDGTHVSGPITQADPHLLVWVGGPSPVGVFDVPVAHKPDTDSEVEARAITAAVRRADWVKRAGGDIDPEDFSDADMVDAIWYSVFPNWSPWGTFNPLQYRFRPNGNDPDSCIFEVMMFVPWGDQANRPAPASVTHLGPDDDWTLAPELGPTAKIFQQDSVNLPHVQAGLKNQESQEVIFANYNESKIRHFWEHLYSWLEIGPTDVAVEPPTRN